MFSTANKVLFDLPTNECRSKYCPSHDGAVQGIFVGIIIKASGATLKLTDSLFAFAF